MTKIEIAYEVDAAAVERVKALLDETSRNNCDWSGVEFQVVRGDFTCIPDGESIAAIQLFIEIERAILGDDCADDEYPSDDE